MFQFYPGERVVVFIDGVSLYSAARSLDFDIDYRRLLHKLRAECHLVRAYYYTTLQEDQDYSPLRPLVDWLAYNGYAMVTKPAKEFTDATGRRRFRGDMDVEVAVDMMEATAFAQHIVLFSGDGDFRRAVEAIQNRGVRVTVVSSFRSQPPMISDDLRRQADVFIELADIKGDISRAPGERPRRAASPAGPGNGKPDDDFENDDEDDDFEDDDYDDEYDDEDEDGDDEGEADESGEDDDDDDGEDDAPAPVRRGRRPATPKS